MKLGVLLLNIIRQNKRVVFTNRYAIPNRLKKEHNNERELHNSTQ